jgi:hypothetical protein
MRSRVKAGRSGGAAIAATAGTGHALRRKRALSAALRRGALIG